jgi:hypothetical protein
MEEDAAHRLPVLGRAPELAGVDPVGLDNEFVAWNAYGNRFWPTLYLIDRAGKIRHTRIGEGGYGRTEAAIRTLLAEVAES